MRLSRPVGMLRVMRVALVLAGIVALGGCTKTIHEARVAPAPVAQHG